MRALQISAYGNPSEVYVSQRSPERPRQVRGEVLIEIELAH